MLALHGYFFWGMLIIYLLDLRLHSFSLPNPIHHSMFLHWKFYILPLLFVPVLATLKVGASSHLTSLNVSSLDLSLGHHWTSYCLVTWRTRYKVFSFFSHIYGLGFVFSTAIIHLGQTSWYIEKSYTYYFVTKIHQKLYIIFFGYRNVSEISEAKTPSPMFIFLTCQTQKSKLTGSLAQNLTMTTLFNLFNWLFYFMVYWVKYGPVTTPEIIFQSFQITQARSSLSPKFFFFFFCP